MRTVMQLLVACWQAMIRTCRTLPDLWTVLMTLLQVSLPPVLCASSQKMNFTKGLLAIMFKPVHVLLCILITFNIFHSDKFTQVGIQPRN